MAINDNNDSGGADVHAQVLVVGLGPVGDVLAALLGQAGISVLAIDREPDLFQLPRAVAFDAEIMRVFQQLTIAEEVLAETRIATDYEFLNADGKRLLHFDTNGPTPSGWSASYLFHQPSLERALRRRLASLPCVDVRLGTSLLTLERNDADGVLAVIAAADGTRSRVTARYLIGCDGGASTVRKLANLELFDYGFEEPWLVVDTLLKSEKGLPSHPIQYCDSNRPATMIPMSSGRRRWEFMLLPGETFTEMLEDARIERLLGKFVAPGQAQVIRKAVYQFHGLVAERWRRQSVVLAGDAAHQMPPFLGQGMCSGIRDAVNLAWKLELVIGGSAAPTLLDSYQIEREPHVRAIIEKAIFMGRIVCTLDPEVARQRDAGMLAQASQPQSGDDLIPKLHGGLLTATPAAGELSLQPLARLRNGQSGRLDDLLGRNAQLISRKPVSSPETAQLSVHTLGRDFDDGGAIEAWLESRNAQAVLVRPDRYVFGTGEPQWLIDQWLSSTASARQ